MYEIGAFGNVLEHFHRPRHLFWGGWSTSQPNAPVPHFLHQRTETSELFKILKTQCGISGLENNEIECQPGFCFRTLASSLAGSFSGCWEKPPARPPSPRGPPGEKKGFNAFLCLISQKWVQFLSGVLSWSPGKNSKQQPNSSLPPPPPGGGGRVHQHFLQPKIKLAAVEPSWGHCEPPKQKPGVNVG